MAIRTSFISYAWDPPEHKAWVREFATRLRRDGVDVKLDQWETVPGDALPEFMERSVRENDFVLIVCTPGYKARSNRRVGGVGYEGDIITGSLISDRNQRKFIPILRDGQWNDAAPSWLSGKYFVDLRGEPYSEDHYQDLLGTILGTREQAPPLGTPHSAGDQTPAPWASSPSLARNHQESGTQSPTPGDLQPQTQKGATHASKPSRSLGVEDFEPLRITGIVVDEVGRPKNDGTLGSALYAVPFRLSRTPPLGWAELFVEAWNHPSSYTTMHRPGIARVTGDRIILDGTTVEEVEQVHRVTLKLAVDEANRSLAGRLELEARRRQREAAEQADHDRRVTDVASRLKFEEE